MSNVLRLAIVDPNDSTRESLKKMLLGMDIVWLEAECSRYEFFADVVGQTAPDVGVVGIDQDPDKALDLMTQLQTASPECSILVVSSSSDGDLILRSMRAGAKEFLPQPVKIEDLVAALQRISNHRYGRADGRPKGCTSIAVCGATGGVGSTSLAVNLGCTLAAEQQHSVVLVDMDLSLGDADVFLDSIPDYTLLDVAQNITRLDFTLLKRSLTKHPSGLYLLPRPIHLHDANFITAENIVRVIGLLKASFSHMIFDVSKSYTEVDMQALRTADHILMTIQLDLPCLRNVVRLLTSFEDEERLRDNTKIIVNRVGLESGEISLKKAQETIGREIFWQLPNDYRTMIEVRNNGVPLVEQAPKAHITQAICGLSDALEGDANAAQKSGKSGLSRWLRLWPNKAKEKGAAKPATP